MPSDPWLATLTTMSTLKTVGILLALILGALYLYYAPEEPSCDERRQEVTHLLQEGITLARGGDIPQALIKQATAEDKMRTAPVCFDGYQ